MVAWDEEGTQGQWILLLRRLTWEVIKAEAISKEVETKKNRGQEESEAGGEELRPAEPRGNRPIPTVGR